MAPPPRLFAAIRVLPRLAAPRHPRMDPFSLDHIILPVPSLIYVKKHLGLTRLELVTSCLSGTRSNHLSYSPILSLQTYGRREEIS